MKPAFCNMSPEAFHAVHTANSDSLARRRQIIADTLSKTQKLADWFLKRVTAYRRKGADQQTARRLAWQDYENLKESRKKQAQQAEIERKLQQLAEATAKGEK